MLESTDEQAGQPSSDIGGLDVRRALQESTDHDRGLEAGKCCPDAEVCALTETDVSPAARAVQPEFACVRKMRRVAIRSTPQQEKARSSGQVDARQRGVIEHVPIMAAERWLV